MRLSAQNVLYITIMICMLILTFIASYAIVHVQRDLSATLRNIDASVTQVSKDEREMTQNVNALLIQAGLAGYEVQAAAREQRAYWRSTSIETTMAVTSVKSLVEHADFSINSVLVPEAHTLLRTATINIDALGTISVESLNHFNEVSVALQRQVSNPAIGEVVVSLAQSSANTAKATESLAMAAGDIQLRVHQATRPASFMMRVGSAILGFGAKVGSVLAGVR